MTPGRILVTGSAGHLGEALVRVLREAGHAATGLDLLASPYTTVTGSVTDRRLVRECLAGADAVLHVPTLHKPHVGSHSRQAFVDTNVTGTLTLLEEAAAAGVGRFVFTSTTSAFGRALTPGPGEPAAWITEDVAPPRSSSAPPPRSVPVTWPGCARTPPPWSAACSRTRRRSTHGGAGGCSRASTGST